MNKDSQIEDIYNKIMKKYGYFKLSEFTKELSTLLNTEIEKANRKWIGRKYIDATPDGGYALRILQAYRQDCDTQWSDNTAGLKISNPFLVELNKLQEERAKEISQAITRLPKSEKDSK